jgi:hypothetical protein
MTPQEQQLITELFARLKQTPAQAGPNPTLTLLANSHKYPMRAIGGHNRVYWRDNRRNLMVCILAPC